jgi:hypothetical protein
MVDVVVVNATLKPYLQNVFLGPYYHPVLVHFLVRLAVGEVMWEFEME